MKKLIELSVRFPGAVLTLCAVAMALGLLAFSRLPLDAVPDITNVQVQVNTLVDGLAPAQIEQQVTFPLEQALSGIPGTENIRSITRPGFVQVTVVFTEGTQILHCRQLVAERLQALQGELPGGAVPMMGPISTGLGEILFYSLEAKKLAIGEARVRQLMDLRDLQDFVVKPRLLTVPGVAEVNSSGGFARQAVIQPDTQMMSRRGMDLKDLAEALERANRNVGGGIVEQGGEQFSVAATGAFSDLETIRNLPIHADQSWSSVRVRDVATVAWDSAPRNGAGTYNGEEAVICTAMMLAGENSRTVAQRVEVRLAEVGKTLPDWAELKLVYSRSNLVDKTLGTVSHNLIFGAALVIFILFLLLGNARAALITAFTIPVSMLMAVIAMERLGISGNLMSLGAIDFGILVDGAVIVLDQCVRYISERRHVLGRSLNKEELKETVLQASIDIRSSAGFGQIIIVVAMLPLFGLTGVEGKTFTPMASTLVLALIAAYVVSFTISPALASLFLSGSAKEGEPWLMRMANRYYPRILAKALHRPVPLLGLGVALLLLTGFAFTRLGAVFMPQLDEGSLMIQFIRPVTISLKESIHLQRLSEKLILEFPEIESTFARMGTPEIATDPMGVNLADTAILFKPLKDWPDREKGRPWNKAELSQAIADKLGAEIPGQRILLTQPIQMRFNELLEGTRADVSVKIYGDDLAKIAEVAGKAAEIIRQVPGAGDVELELRGTSPILSVEPRPEILGSMGLSQAQVLEAVEIGLAGKETGLLYEGPRRYPVMVRMAEDERQDLEAVKRLPVGVGGGGTRPLQDLARLKYTDSYPSISREQAKRRAAILINPRGRDLEGFVTEAGKKLEDAKIVPPGYYVEWGGSFQNLRLARNRLALLTPLALGLVLMMVYAAFRSVKLTLLVFTGIPLALVGGVAGLALRGMPFSISAGVGFIALAGIAALNGVVLISSALSIFKDKAPWPEAIRKAAETRLRPVLMTALVDIFGFLPMMFSTGLGAEVQQPLATVVVGGVISSTALTLLMLPSWGARIKKLGVPGEVHVPSKMDKRPARSVK